MKVLSVAVHPDDETLGCGATLLKHSAQGDTLHWLLVTAATRRDFSKEQVAKQERQIKAVSKAFPFDSLDWLKVPSTRLAELPFNHLVNAIREVVEQLRPEIIFVPNRSDAHSDHRIAFAAIQAVVKSFYMLKLGVRQILSCEVLSETEAATPLPENAFLPNVYVDVSATLQGKIDIMRLYRTELHAEPLPRTESAIRALARFRGATIGVEHAEAFMLIREIVA